MEVQVLSGARNALVVKLADTLDSKPSSARSVGSSPTEGTRGIVGGLTVDQGTVILGLWYNWLTPLALTQQFQVRILVDSRKVRHRR